VLSTGTTETVTSFGIGTVALSSYLGNVVLGLGPVKSDDISFRAHRKKQQIIQQLAGSHIV
jgi:hypothetical protein